MNYSDIKRLYPSSGYMKTSLVDGRTVIDKQYDASNDLAHQAFAGNDRPELHQTLDGKYQTCVEKGVTNLFLNSAELSTQDVTVTADPYTVAFEGTGTITFSGVYTGALEGVEGERVEITFTPTAGTLTCTVSGLVEKAQIEQSEYATLWIPTTSSTVTRPATFAPYDNFLPDTGAVGWCGRMVNTNTYILENMYTNADTQRFSIRLFAGNWALQVYGTDGGFISGIGNPIGGWGFNTRKDIAVIGSWDTSKMYLWLCDLDGNLHGYSEDHDINDSSVKDVIVGARTLEDKQSSTRTANLQPTTEIIDTAEKAKDFIEILTRGSYNIKASEITLMNP